jgi:hypothetical protein
MDTILNKIINIVAKEESLTKAKTNTQVKLTDQDGIRFAFFKKKKDGNLTSVAEQFKNMRLDEGSTVKIGYVIETYTGTDGKSHTTNKIINFQETGEQAVKGAAQPSQPVQKSQPQPKYEPIEPKGEEFWEKKALKQCIWAYALQKGLPTFGSADCELVYNAFKSIELFADKKFATGMEKARLALSEEPPIETYDEPANARLNYSTEH